MRQFWTALAVALVAIFVDLKPQVDENFFFSASDPQFQQSKKVEEHFPPQPELIRPGARRRMCRSTVQPFPNP